MVPWPNAFLPFIVVVGEPTGKDVVILPLETWMFGLLEDHLTCLFVASLGEMVAVMVALSPSTRSMAVGSRVIPVTEIVPGCFSQAKKSVNDAKTLKRNPFFIM